MDQLKADQAIFGRWAAMWPGLSGSVPYVFDNVTKPESSLFARVSIVSGQSVQWTMGPSTGSRKWQRRGMIDVRLTGPINVGRGQLDELAQKVREIYEGARFGRQTGEQGVVAFATTVGERRKDKDSSLLWVVSASTPFEFYEVR